MRGRTRQGPHNPREGSWPVDAVQPLPARTEVDDFHRVSGAIVERADEDRRVAPVGLADGGAAIEFDRPEAGSLLAAPVARPEQGGEQRVAVDTAGRSPTGKCQRGRSAR